jgi:formate dehydrogenase major subunit
MEMANITINGQAISAPVGSTILQAAMSANIDIPTLCNHRSLRPAGSCRICVVEVRGQRVLQTACTFPITEGMEVETETPRVVGARKLVIDLLFSERNHYCPYCEMSGSCELQSLGYRYGLNHWVYPTYLRPFPVDASHKYLLMEHNRCVLCGRCYRACDELAANHTLGLRQRGAKSMIHADVGIPWGESSCISCGTCAQVCPTGTLTDKRSAYMGRNDQMQYVDSACSQCSMGCGMKIVTRNDRVLRIEGDWDAGFGGGLLCEKGRFAPLFDQRERLTRPLIRKNGRLEAAGWDEALRVAAERIGGGKGGELGVLTSSNATNEALYLAGRLFRDALKTANIGLLNEASSETPAKPGGLFADLAKSDIIVLAGADPVRDQPVASFLLKQNVDAGGRLILVGDEENGLAPFACMIVGMDDIGQAVEVAERAENPLVLYGSGLTGKAAETLKRLEGKAVFIALEPGVNTRAAKAYGLDGQFQPSDAKVLYVLLGEQSGDGADPIGRIGKESFVIAQACYASAVTRRADVVLPMAIWSERAGSLTNTEGRLLKLNRAVEPAGEAKADWEILALLAERLGLKIGSSPDEVAAAIRK